MISYRKADILKRIKDLNPIKGVKPKIGTLVYVHEPEYPEEKWYQAFTGTIIDTKNVTGGDAYYVVRDDENNNIYVMGERSFEVANEYNGHLHNGKPDYELPNQSLEVNDVVRGLDTSDIEVG